MKRFILVTVLALFAASLVFAEEKRTDQKSFEITPAAPPVPALKYQLLFDNYVARRPGNAAIFYFRALMFQTDGINKEIDAALEEYDKGNDDAVRHAKFLDRRTLLDELDLAARCSDCDWQDPLRDFGYKTLLPQLGPMRSLDHWLKVRGLSKVLDGKLDDALATTRLGYEMSRKTAVGPTLVSGLVSLAMIRDMDDVLAKLMDQPQAPNLYWTLRQFPELRPILQSDTSMERLSAAWAMPQLAKVLDGQEITIAQWHESFDTIKDILQTNNENGQAVKTADPVADSSPEMLQQAQRQYIMKHRDLGSVDAAQAKVDPTQAIGEFYFLTFVNDYDEIYKLSGLPYPQLLPRAQKFESQTWKECKDKQPANIFLQTSPAISKVAQRFALTDRQIAALAAVQAISAYAAGHENQLPAKLADILDTPAPENPETGLPFEYKIDGDHAVLADSDSQEPLEYTIKIRK
jgi:hypothetical protein